MAFTALETTLSAAAAFKLENVNYAKECFLTAKNLEAAGDGDKREAQLVSSEGAMALVEVMVDDKNPMAREEMNAILGDLYGWKITPATGKQSKTPEGKGNDIRKRIIRYVDAVAYANGAATAPKFLEGVEAQTVADSLLEAVQNQTSIWTVYDTLGGLKAKPAPVELALNAKRIAELVESLSNVGNMTSIAADPALLAIYSELHSAMGTLNAVVTEYLEAEAEAEAKPLLRKAKKAA
jgi:hypothetical protein